MCYINIIFRVVIKLNYYLKAVNPPDGSMLICILVHVLLKDSVAKEESERKLF